MADKKKKLALVVRSFLKPDYKTLVPNLTRLRPDNIVLYKKSADYLKDKFTNGMNLYQNFIGLTELREAQYRVMIANEMLEESNKQLRDARIPLYEVQSKLQEVQMEIRNTRIDDDRYLVLLQKEHGLVKELKNLKEMLLNLENEERDCLRRMGTALRSSHEAERFQAEKTKYYAIIVSIVATLLSLIGSSVNNRIRIQELKDMIVDLTKTENSQKIMMSLNEISKKLGNDENIQKVMLTMNENEKLGIITDNPQNIILSLNEISKKLDNLGNDQRIIEMPKQMVIPPENDFWQTTCIIILAGYIIKKLFF